MLAVADHIEVDKSGVAKVAGSRIKVHQLIADHKAWGWNVAELQAQFPHLSLSQIHAAFVYYYDHQVEIDLQIAQDEEKVRQARGVASGGQPTADDLRARLAP